MKIAIIFGFIAAIVVYAFAPQIVSVFALEQGPHHIISFKALSLLGGDTAPLLSEENPKSWGGRGACWQGVQKQA